MAVVNLFRVDTRLVHGQICTRWSKEVDINRILVINNELVKDPFMANIYKMSAPKGVKVEIIDTASAIDGWKKDELGTGRIMIIVKEIITSYELFSAGFPIKEINLGNLISSAQKVAVLKNVFLSEDEFKMLKEMNDSGTRIYIQNVPDHEQQSFSVIEKKFNS